MYLSNSYGPHKNKIGMLILLMKIHSFGDGDLRSAVTIRSCSFFLSQNSTPLPIMTAYFYDKKEQQIDNTIKDLNQRVDKLQKVAPSDQAYIRLSEQRFASHNHFENQEIAHRLVEAHRDAKLKVTVGIAVGIITVWELIKGARGLFRWVRRELAEKDQETSVQRLHARDWGKFQES